METTFDFIPCIPFQPLQWARSPVAPPASLDRLTVISKFIQANSRWPVPQPWWWWQEGVRHYFLRSYLSPDIRPQLRVFEPLTIYFIYMGQHSKCIFQMVKKWGVFPTRFVLWVLCWPLTQQQTSGGDTRSPCCSMDSNRDSLNWSPAHASGDW